MHATANDKHTSFCGFPKKRVIFRKGRPLGAGRTNQMALWDRYAQTMKTPPEHFDGLDNLYSYGILQKVFPWAKVFRAGLVMIYKQPSSCEMLLVHQREMSYRDGATTRVIPMRRGPPKGAADANDKSALQTALREGFEETGVDVLNPKFEATLTPTTFVIPRSEEGVEEVMIYFLVVFNARPEIHICEVELTGYEWVDMTENLKGIENLTTPTQLLMKMLEDVNIWGDVRAVELPAYL